MKKTYMKPELEAMELKMNTTILAGSLARSEDEAPVDGGGEYESLGRDNDFNW